MVPQVAAGARGVGRIQPDVIVWLAAIGVAWVAAYWLEVSGAAHLLHHHTIYHSGQILVGGLALLGAWQVMTAAMMLPGALPAVLRVSPGRAQLVFIVAYAAAWTAFAALAFVGDMGLHALVHGWALAARHENLIPVAILGTAAVYQVSPWKRASLAMCRKPVRVDTGALTAGVTYSRHCLISSWALMLIMFSAGVAVLAWMAALALAMLAEKTGPSGASVRFVVAGSLGLLAAWSLVAGT